MALESRVPYKSSGRGFSESLDDEVQLRYDQSADYTRAHALYLAASSSSRSVEGAEATLSVSLDDNCLANGAFGNTTKRVVPAVLKDERDSFAKVRPCVCLGVTLPICSRNLRAVRDEPIAVLFDDCRELVVHGDAILPRSAAVYSDTRRGDSQRVLQSLRVIKPGSRKAGGRPR